MIVLKGLLNQSDKHVDKLLVSMANSMESARQEVYPSHMGSEEMICHLTVGLADSFVGRCISHSANEGVLGTNY